MEILIVEDNDGLREVVKEALSDNYSVTACISAEEAFGVIKEKNFDIVITDLSLPEADGISVLEAVKDANPETEVIVVTAYGTVDKAVDAMKKGAADFITKPFSIDHIRVQVAKILKNKTLKTENRYLKGLIRKEIIGESSKVREIVEFAGKVAEKDATVLITGESGTGKELVAEEIYYKGNRRDYPFIKVNCAALAPGVLESELFGHEKGAFTDAHVLKKGRFEMADKGILFLDEIADLPKDLQVKLLRVIQEKEFERVGGEKSIKVDVRVIAATNRDLKKAVAEGTFREELYYRLNVVEIAVPPLRDRKEDIPLLIRYFIKKYAEYSNFNVKDISPQALEKISEYDFPGNIRELENIIQRILVLCQGEIIEVSDIPTDIGLIHKKSTGEGLSSEVEAFEKNLILEALEKTNGNRMQAAEILKMNRATLISKIKKYGL